MIERILTPYSKAFFAVLLLCAACVDPYLENFNGDETIFIVDGILTNVKTGNYVKLTEAVPNSGSSTSYLPVEKANV